MVILSIPRLDVLGCSSPLTRDIGPDPYSHTAGTQGKIGPHSYGCHSDGYGWWSGGGGRGGCGWLLRFIWMFIIIILMSSLYYFNQSGKKIESLMLLGVLK